MPAIHRTTWWRSSAAPEGEDTLFNFTERVIERLLQLKHVGTARNYRAALCSFKRFRGNMDLPMEEIDTILVEDYLAYLKSDRLMPNSISFYIRILRSVYNRAVEQELIEDTKPFRTVSTGMEKTLKRAIPIGEIRRIKRLDLMFRPDLEFARDMFLFLFLCRGMSFIDAAYLKKEDIRGGILTYRRQKTGQALHIKIIEPIKELVDRYSDKESPYLLPVITPSGGRCPPTIREGTATCEQRAENNREKGKTGCAAYNIHRKAFLGEHRQVEERAGQCHLRCPRPRFHRHHADIPRHH